LFVDSGGRRLVHARCVVVGVMPIMCGFRVENVKKKIPLFAASCVGDDNLSAHRGKLKAQKGGLLCGLLFVGCLFFLLLASCPHASLLETAVWRDLVCNGRVGFSPKISRSEDAHLLVSNLDSWYFTNVNQNNNDQCVTTKNRCQQDG